MRIYKVKLKEKALTIEYGIPNGEQSIEPDDAYDDFSIVYKKANPAPQLPEAFRLLRASCLELCEMQNTFKEEFVTVTGVSFSYGGEKEVMGATISFQIKLFSANTPLCLNTPHKPSDSYNDDSGNNTGDLSILSFSTVKALYQLLTATTGFIMGERGQIQIEETKEEKQVKGVKKLERV